MSEPITKRDDSVHTTPLWGELKIVVSHQDQQTQEILKSAIEQLHHICVSRCESCEEVRESFHSDQPDLIITGLNLYDGHAVDLLLELARERPLPAIVVSSRTSLAAVEEALRDHVMAYLVEPVSVEEIKPTIHLVMSRFQEFQHLRQRNENLREHLEVRKQVERAKGLLMGRLNLTERQAHDYLQKLAKDTRTKLQIVAENVLQPS